MLKRLIERRLGSFAVVHPRATAGLLVCATLMAAGTAWGDEMSCPRLFAEQRLNEASHEYVIRLQYLIRERHLLAVETLQQIIESPRPFNPMGDKATQIVLQPHHQAFSDLLKRDLQWDLIRQRVKALSQLVQQEKRRADAASEETADLPRFHIIKSIPLTGDHVVRTASGQVLAIAIEPDTTAQKTNLKVYDVLNDAEVTKKSVPQQYLTLYNEVKAIKNSAVLSLLDFISQEMLTFDALTGNLSSVRLIPKEPIDRFGNWGKNAPSGLHLVERNGEVVAVTFSSEDIYLVDALSGLPKNRITVPGLPSDRAFSGTFGSLVFVSGKYTPTFLIDPWGQQPVQTLDGITAMAFYSYRGQSYALGLDKDDKLSGVGAVTLKSVNLATKQASQSFLIPKIMEDPRLLETFEHDGTLYGLIATDQDAVIVDLLKGEVVQLVSRASLDRTLFLNWSSKDAGHVGFSFKGQFYLLAGVRQPGQPNVRKLVIVDPLTLTPLSAPFEVSSNIIGLRMIQKEGKQAAVLVKLADGKSLLVSLVGTINSANNRL